MVDFYSDLYDRADKLFMTACNKTEAILTAKVWEVSQIISCLYEYTSMMDKSEMWKSDTCVWFNDEVQVMRELATAHKKKGKAMSLLCSFAKKLRDARAAKRNDEANN